MTSEAQFIVMSESASGFSLTGQLLVAMPQMRDPRFTRSVIYMCAHNAEGAMGLVINRLVGSITFPDMLEQLGITAGEHGRQIKVHFGGPVDAGRGFVLHSDEYRHEGTVAVVDGMALTATIDILKDIAGGRGPPRESPPCATARGSPRCAAGRRPRCDAARGGRRRTATASRAPRSCSPGGRRARRSSSPGWRSGRRRAARC